MLKVIYFFKSLFYYNNALCHRTKWLKNNKLLLLVIILYHTHTVVKYMSKM